MQLVDREQFERIIDRYIDETGADTFTKDHLIDFLLDSDPVDAVPVVRCKGCKHYRQDPWNKEVELLCMNWTDWLPTAPDDFCSYGERKSDNE